MRAVSGSDIIRILKKKEYISLDDLCKELNTNDYRTVERKLIKSIDGARYDREYNVWFLTTEKPTARNILVDKYGVLPKDLRAAIDAQDARRVKYDNSPNHLGSTRLLEKWPIDRASLDKENDLYDKINSVSEIGVLYSQDECAGGFKYLNRRVQVITSSGKILWVNIMNIAQNAGANDSYYISEKAYKQLISFGVPVCKVYTKKLLTNETAGESKYSKNKHIMELYGYSVTDKTNLSETQRQVIILNLIKGKIMSIDDVLHVLETKCSKSKSSDMRKKLVADQIYLQRYKNEIECEEYYSSDLQSTE